MMSVSIIGGTKCLSNTTMSATVVKKIDHQYLWEKEKQREEALQKTQNPWTILNHPEEWTKFSQANANEEGVWASYLAIDGMHCAACAINIERSLKTIPGVLNAQVNAASGRATVSWQEKQVKPSSWLQAISDAGYGVMPATEYFAQDDRRHQQRLMLWRLLVAAFCMIQVMMYSMPAYYASPGEISANTLNLMRWASWVLSLPVLFFSCGPFYKNAFKDLKRQQISMDLPVALGITITFLVSSAATFDPSGWWGGEVYFDSMTMLVFFLLTGRWLELRMRDKTAGALDALMRRLPKTVERLGKDKKFTRIAASQLQVGDIIRVLPGEAFPGDGVLTTGNTHADESLLTGESKPISKNMGQVVIAGSHNLTGIVNVKITQTGNTTRYAQIVSLMERAATEKPRLAMLADRIAKPFLWCVLFAAAGSAIYLWHVEPSKALMTAVAVLIVTCPCALSLATPAAMLSSAGAMAKTGLLVRKLQAIEALTTCDTVIFDKTGTLTLDQMTIGEVRTSKAFQTDQALELAAAIAKHSLHPVSKALVNAIDASRELNDLVRNVKEIAGSGLIAESDFGELKLGNASFCGIKEIKRGGYCLTKVHLVLNQVWLASFDIVESIKPDAASTIALLKQQGYQLSLLSGDHAASVKTVADKLGIDEALGDCRPEDKLAQLQSLHQQGKKVLMIGDGLNDGPVLAMADVSIAMGQAVPLAQAQSDFVLLTGQLEKVTQLMQQAKKTMTIVKQNLIWAAAYNAICVPLAVAGLLPAWLAGLGMALSSLLVVLNARRLSTIAVTTQETV